MDRMSMNDACDEVFNRRHAPRGMDDSDRNIMADLAGEADEPCFVCDTPVRPRPISPMRDDFEFKTVTGEPLCEDCFTT